MLHHQNGACAGCQNPPGKTRLSIDHDHRTGLIRGLLCWRCNAALQALRDDAQTAYMLSVYLTDPPASHALGRTVYGLLGKAMPSKKRKKYGPPDTPKL